MTTVYPRPDTSRPLTLSDLRPPLRDPDDWVDPVDQAYAATREVFEPDDWAKPLQQPPAQVRQHRTVLTETLAGLPALPDLGELLDALARLDPVNVVRLVGLITLARATGDGQPRHTPPLALTAGAVEAIYTSGPTTHMQVLDSSDEHTWRGVAAVLECEEDEEHDHAAADCVVLLSEAFADGGAHLPADWDLSVRILAGEQ